MLVLPTPNVPLIGIPGSGSKLSKTDLVFAQGLKNPTADGIWPDYGGLGNDAVGYSARSVSFNGTSDYASVPHASEQLIAGKTVTISGWFKPSLSATVIYLLAKRDLGTAFGGYRIYIDATDKLVVNTKQAGTADDHHNVVSTDDCLDGVWNYFTATLDDGEITALTLNDAAQTISGATTGTYGDDTSTALFICARELNGAVAGFFDGEIADLKMVEGSTELFHYQLWDGPTAGGTLTPYPLIDSSGNGNHGTFVGCTGIRQIGGVSPCPPQVGAGEFNRRMWFDGVDDYVETSFQDLDGTDSFEIEATVRTDTDSSGAIMFVSNASSATGFKGISLYSPTADPDQFGIVITEVITTNDIKVFSNDGSFDIRDGNTHKVKVTYDGSKSSSGIKLYHNDVEVSGYDIVANTLTGDADIAQTYSIGGNFEGGLLFEGLLYDVSIRKGGVLVNQWKGYGNTDADWKDQIGTNHGTVSGSPTQVLIPQAPSLTDSFGNAIDNPRLRPSDFKGDNSGYLKVLDDPALDVGSAMTLVAVGNFWSDSATALRFVGRWDSGNNKDVFLFLRASLDSATGGKLRFVLSSVGNGVSEYGCSFVVQNKRSVLTFIYNGSTFKVYEDGVELTVTVEAGSVPASLFSTDIGVLIGGSYNSDSEIPAKLIHAVDLYDVAFDDSQISKVTRYYKQRYSL